VLALTILASATSAADRDEPTLFPVETRWTLALHGAATAPPAFDGVHAYFPIDGSRTVAYDLSTGARLWIAPVGTDVEPAAGDDLVFLVTPRSVVALNAANGSVAWELPMPDALVARPVWDTGWLVLSTADGSILAYRASDGHLIWRHDVGSPAHAPPALAGRRIYVPAEDGRIVTLALEDGHLLWERRLGGAAGEILALDDRLYAGSKDNYLYCLDTKDGAEHWRWRTGGDVIGMPVVDERAVYFVSLDNVLRSLSRRSGVQFWKAALPMRPTAGPIKARDSLLVTGLTDTLRAYHMRDGKPAGEITLPGELIGQPYVLDRSQPTGPLIVAAAQEIAAGETVTAVAHTVEPKILAIAPLPNVEPVTASKPAPKP
jgi:outer membrane protein assembly factor BamB